MKQKLFVYGTLRKGESRHHALGEANCIASIAYIHGKLVDTGHGYPAVISDTEHLVAGELYEIDDAIVPIIDGIEGYIGPGDAQNLYERVKCDVYTDRDIHIAWTYVSTNFSSLSAIAHGDWKLFQLRKQQHLHYFAYGSCMDTGRFNEDNVADCFTDVIGRGICEGFNLQFTRRSTKPNDQTGKADIVETGGTVEGKLYRIPEEVLELPGQTGGRRSLFSREGVGSRAYRPVVVPVRLDDGRVVDALTFVVVKKESSPITPSQVYMTEILVGAKPIVSADYYAALKRRFETQFGYISSEMELM